MKKLNTAEEFEGHKAWMGMSAALKGSEWKNTICKRPKCGGCSMCGKTTHPTKRDLREIKFRAWHIPGERMVYYEQYGDENYDCGYHWEGWQANAVEAINMILQKGGYDDEYVFEQFTGLLDKNAKEIYKGDIVKHGKNSDIGLIQYVDKFAAWFVGTAQMSSSYGFEVIGNIHENEELIA